MFGGARGWEVGGVIYGIPDRRLVGSRPNGVGSALVRLEWISTMARFVIAPDVKEALEASLLQRAEAERDIRCVVCRERVDVSADAEVAVSVVHQRDEPEIKRIFYSHPGCLPSRVIVTDEPVIEDAPVNLQTFWMVRQGRAPHAVLVIGVPHSYSLGPGGGLPRLQMIDALRELGFQRITASIADAMPAVVRKLSLVVGEMDEELVPSFKLRDQDATELCDYHYAVHLDEVSEAWIDVLKREREGLILAMAMAGDVDQETIARAIVDEAVIGARVRLRAPASWGVPPEAKSPHEEVAFALQRASAERAPAPGQRGGPLASLPDVVPLPAHRHLLAVQLADLPSLFLTVPGAPEVLDGLERAGLHRLRELNGPIPALVEEGWSYLLWRDQVLVLGPGGRKVLFDRIAPPRGWYEGVKRGLGLFVKDETTAVLDWKALEDLMRRGHVVCGALAGMKAE